MVTPTEVHQALPGAGAVYLGRTVPSLLDEACDRTANPFALNQWTTGGWQSLSHHDFRTQAEALALGLLDLGLERGDRIVLLLESDVTFVRVDMACLLAGLITVPINMGETLDNIEFMVQHSGAKALIIAEETLLAPLTPYLDGVEALMLITVVGSGGQPQPYALDGIQQRGKALWSWQRGQDLRSHLCPQDLATIIYVAGPTGKCQTLRNPEPPPPPMTAPDYVCEQPKGVMLTHENLTADALTAFGAIPGLEEGPRETVLSFLPLTHIFARVLFYGHLAYGHTVYFSTPLRVIKHLREIQPTILATVPRLLEKVHQTILEKSGQLTGWRQIVAAWAMRLARRQRVGALAAALDAWELPFADRLVFAQWRSVFGNRLTYLLCGGAALRTDLAHWYATIGLPVMQGYGLTQTSAVLSVNRGHWHRAGTVGKLIAGVEIAIAPDQEILVKAPYVMRGYYHNLVATQEAIDAEGWFHTGDLGSVSADGYLTITGHKKSLFKLSIGKYVTPEPIEHYLRQSPLVNQAVVVGNQRPYCALLVFPNLRKIREFSQRQGLYLADAELVGHPLIRSQFQTLIDQANQQVPAWSKVKRFRLMNATLTAQTGLLSVERGVNRGAISKTFASEIEMLYGPTYKTVRSRSEPLPELGSVQDGRATAVAST